MARANLSALLGNVETPAPAVTDPGTGPSADASMAAAPRTRPARPRPESAQVEESAALYLRLVRKEARLREEQYAALTQHARRLSRARRGQGARITENTLIRIAVDLMLDQIDRAVGIDEYELRESLR